MHYRGTDKFSDWFKQTKVSRPLRDTPDYQWIVPGKTRGKLIGGCMPSLKQLVGTEFDFDYNNALLFLDIPEGDILGKGLSPAKVDSLLSDLNLSRKLSKVNGVILGRLFRQQKEDEGKIKELFYERFKSYGIPVLYGANITHADPKTTIPLGTYATLDSRINKFELNEQGVN